MSLDEIGDEIGLSRERAPNTRKSHTPLAQTSDEVHLRSYL